MECIQGVSPRWNTEKKPELEFENVYHYISNENTFNLLSRSVIPEVTLSFLIFNETIIYIFLISQCNIRLFRVGKLSGFGSRGLTGFTTDLLHFLEVT